MSRDVCNREQNEKKHVTFETLISDTEARIKEHQSKVKALRKSLVFFKKQASLGIPLPALEGSRHGKTS